MHLIIYCWCSLFQLQEVEHQAEEEKKKLLLEFQQQKGLWEVSKEHEMSSLKDAFHNDLADAEQRARARADTDAKVC